MGSEIHDVLRSAYYAVALTFGRGTAQVGPYTVARYDGLVFFHVTSAAGPTENGKERVAKGKASDGAALRLACVTVGRASSCHRALRPHVLTPFRWKHASVRCAEMRFQGVTSADEAAESHV